MRLELECFSPGFIKHVPGLHKFDIILIVWSLHLFFFISKVPTAISFQGNARESIESQQRSNYYHYTKYTMGLFIPASNAEPNLVKVYLKQKWQN